MVRTARDSRIPLRLGSCVPAHANWCQIRCKWNNWYVVVVMKAECAANIEAGLYGAQRIQTTSAHTLLLHKPSWIHCDVYTHINNLCIILLLVLAHIRSRTSSPHHYCRFSLTLPFLFLLQLLLMPSFYFLICYQLSVIWCQTHPFAAYLSPCQHL